MPNVKAISSGFYRKATRKLPNSTITVLTMTSKMPCPSWSLPARTSCPNAVVSAGSICERCYANGRAYKLYPCIAKAQNARFDWARECMKTPMGRLDFVTHMVGAIQQTKTRYFRVHDSGDMFSPAYADC